MSNLIVGLTGGIGSGKTAVSDRFSKLGIGIVDADVIAREVVEPGTEALAKIATHFGNDLIQEDGQLNRAALRQTIFADANAKPGLSLFYTHSLRMRHLDSLAGFKAPTVFMFPRYS